MKTFWFGLALMMLYVPLAHTQAPAPQKHKILTLELKATLIEKEVVELIDGLISSELGRYGALDVITSADMRQLAALEADKQAMGCDKNASCLAELAGALGARLVIFGQIGKLGSSIILNINLFDSQQATAVGRVTLRAASLDTLPDQIPRAVQDLLSQFSTKVAKPPAPLQTVQPAHSPQQSVYTQTQPSRSATPKTPSRTYAKAVPQPNVKPVNPTPVDELNTNLGFNYLPFIGSSLVAVGGGLLAGLYGYPSYAQAYEQSTLAQGIAASEPNSAEAANAYDVAQDAQSAFLGGPVYGLVGGSVMAIAGMSAAVYFAITPVALEEKPVIGESPTWTD